MAENTKKPDDGAAKTGAPGPTGGAQPPAAEVSATTAAKDTTGKTAYLNAPHGFGIHFAGKLYRFKKGLNAIADEKATHGAREITLVEFLGEDTYVKANNGEVVYK